MSKGNSIHASVAINALNASGFLNSVIRGSICDPSLGEAGNHPNAAFFGDVEWYLSCRQIAHAGDTLNTYCQNILAEILITDSSTWPLVKKQLRSKNRETAIESLRIQWEVDGSVRKALREGLDAYWCGEMEIIAELRNRIVHQAGMDPEGKIRKTILAFPPGKQFIPPASLDPTDFPIDLDSGGKLLIDAKTGHWATQHVMHHIDMLDQHLCHRFGLPRSRKPIRKIGFHVSENSSAFTLFPGTPLPVIRMAHHRPASTFQLSPFPNYKPMPKPEEIACVATWRKVYDEIHEFVRQICEESEVEICELDSSLAGVIHTHTVQGHDHHLGFSLRPKDSFDSKPKFLGVRLRQEKFKPFITIWGTHTQMHDFEPCELTEEVKEYLHNCINHAISR